LTFSRFTSVFNDENHQQQQQQQCNDEDTFDSFCRNYWFIVYSPSRVIIPNIMMMKYEFEPGTAASIIIIIIIIIINNNTNSIEL